MSQFLEFLRVIDAALQDVTFLLSEPATFVQRLPNVYAMDVWSTLGSRCTNVTCSLGYFDISPDFSNMFHYNINMVLLACMSYQTVFLFPIEFLNLDSRLTILDSPDFFHFVN